MQNGAVLEVRFNLKIRDDQSVDTTPSLQSHLNGVTIGGIGGPDTDTGVLNFIFFFATEPGYNSPTTLDGVERKCPGTFHIH